MSEATIPKAWAKLGDDPLRPGRKSGFQACVKIHGAASIIAVSMSPNMTLETTSTVVLTRAEARELAAALVEMAGLAGEAVE